MNLEDQIKISIERQDVNNDLDAMKVSNLASDLGRFVELAIRKYIKGQREHGGCLDDRDLMAELENELIDHVHYFNALRRREAQRGYPLT